MFRLFRHNPPKSAMPLALDLLRYSGDASRKYSVTPEEEAFFAAFDKALAAAKKSKGYTVTRMANGALSVSSSRAFLGKVKLQGRKTWMQYMKNLYDADQAEDAPLEEYISLLKYWVKTA